VNASLTAGHATALVHDPFIVYAPVKASAKQASVRCLRTEIHAGSQAHGWREVQANMGMAALLMPREPFLDRVRAALEARDPVFPPLDPLGSVGLWLTDEIAHCFLVSRQATALRLTSFGLLRRRATPVE
jgi:Zn-dependent peptidase ImmA (M78 family)